MSLCISKTAPDRKGDYPHTVRFLYNGFSETPNPKINTERIDGYLRFFFKPYWKKRDD